MENGVWREDLQLNEMYLIGAGANDLVLGHPNWNAHSNENRHYCDTRQGMQSDCLRR